MSWVEDQRSTSQRLVRERAERRHEKSSAHAATPLWYQRGGRFGFVAEDWFRNAATAGALLVAIVSFIVAIVTYNLQQTRALEQRKFETNNALKSDWLAREINTDNMWIGQKELSIGYPQFADGANFSSLSNCDKVRYSWFVERLFYVGETILIFEKRKAEFIQQNPSAQSELSSFYEDWQSVFKVEAEKHISFIEASPKFLNEYLCDYDEGMQEVISDVSTLAEARLATCEDEIDDAELALEPCKITEKMGATSNA